MNKINSLFSLFMIPRLREVIRPFKRFAAIVLVLLSCSSPDFNNTFDPYSVYYVPAVQGILIDDFDDGTLLNQFGYPTIPFGDANVLVTHIAGEHVALRGTGFSLQIEFDVRSPDTACGGWVWPFVELGPEGESMGVFDLNTLHLNDLTFWTKMESQGLNFEIALKDTSEIQTDPKLLISDYTPEMEIESGWKKYRIPLSDLQETEEEDQVGFGFLKEFNIGFSRLKFEEEGGDLVGLFYIDEIAFER